MDLGPKIVLLSLADTVSSGEDRCWCKQETLMRRCGMGETALRGHIKALRGWGLVATNIRRTHTEYVLSIRDDDDTDYSRPSESEAQHPRKTRVTPSESEAPTVEEPVVVTGSIKPGIAHEQPMIPLPQRLCLQLSAALRINAQPATAVSSTHPGMLALVKAIPREWEDTALAMAPDVVKELVANGKAGTGLYAYTLAVLKTRIERAVSQSGQVAGVTKIITQKQSSHSGIETRVYSTPDDFQ